VKRLCLLLGLLLALPAASQEATPKKKKKPAVTKVKAHQKPTPEQIRRFNELEKKK
jgi:hypothetical protein